MNTTPSTSSTSPMQNTALNVCKTCGLALAIVTTALLTACGGGGTTTDQPAGAIAPASATGLRPFPAAYTNRIAVSYSPFRSANRDTETITDAMVKQDLDLLVQAGIGVIRLFDSSEKVALRTLRVIHNNNLDIKVQLGMFVNGYEYITDPVQKARVQADNEEEMARGVALANSFSQVIATSVGNETLASFSAAPLSTGALAVYLKKVRDQTTQPITTDDNWAPYAGLGRNATDQIVDILREVDFASIHTYSHEDAFFSNFTDSFPNPDWDWQQTDVTDLTKRATAMMDAAIAKTKKDYAAARTFMDKNGRANLPIVIGETGWKAADPSGNGRYKFLSAPANQKMYYSRLLEWAAASKTDNGPKGVIYFEAFDEPWKGADDKWGLFNVQRQARCAAQLLKPTATWAKETANCNDSAAVFFNPPKLNPPLAQATLVIHNESTTGFPIGLRSDAFEVGTFGFDYPALGDSAPSDQAATLTSSHFLRLRDFTPKDYGWGLLWQSDKMPVETANMSEFANGFIRFSIKTSYIGGLRISISSDTEAGSPVEANLIVSGDKYGYCNTGTRWCDVSIPLSAFKTANPRLDLRYVLTRFLIADIFAETGNTARTGMPSIALDNIYWSK